MSSSSTKPARGMRDFLPADVRRRSYVIDVVRDVYEGYGFEPLETPAVENLETLMGKYGEEGNQLVFRIQKRGEKLEEEAAAVSKQVALELVQEDEEFQGLLKELVLLAFKHPGLQMTDLEVTFKDLDQPARAEAVERAATSEGIAEARRTAKKLEQRVREKLKTAVADLVQSDSVDLALRYDLTVPLARVVAEYRAQLPKFFKRYQIQPVWRADRPARGRFREFYQCDLDILGTRSMVVEAELCAAVTDVLDRLGFQQFAIRLNHRQLLAALLDVANVPPDRAGDALVALDKLDKIGATGVEGEFAARGLDPAASRALLDLFASVDAIVESLEEGESALALNKKVYERLAAFIGDHAAGRQALAELAGILAFSAETPAGGRLRIDPSLARGLSYYTGAIMEIAVPDLAGSLGGGGRYDNLVGMFLGQDVPACGFSLGLERIIVVMTERGMFPEGLDAAPADVMVTLWNPDRIGDALSLARDLRAATLADGRRLRVDVYPEPDKIGKQFKYASSRGIPKVVVAGDDEIAQGTVTIKDMRTGEQQTVARREAAPVCLQ